MAGGWRVASEDGARTGSKRRSELGATGLSWRLTGRLIKRSLRRSLLDGLSRGLLLRCHSPLVPYQSIPVPASPCHSDGAPPRHRPEL